MILKDIYIIFADFRENVSNAGGSYFCNETNKWNIVSRPPMLPKLLP